MAGRFPREWLEQLRQRADIVKVVGSYVALKKNGHRYVGLCPFHNETAPSFSVNEERQSYYCFGCKASGSSIQFIMEMEHMSFPEAVAHLAEQEHMPLPEMQNDPDYEKKRSLKERIYLANKMAAGFYHEQLWQPEGAHILDYLHGRGLSDGVIRRFGLGAAYPSGKITQKLLSQGFTKEELVQSGLTLLRDDQSPYDMFRNRAIFPIIDGYGNVLGFGGRAMGDALPKYLNTGDTLAFNKRYNVYAANFLRKAKGLQQVLLVEGYMDVVALSQFGLEGVAATLGTALTPEQARLLHRYAPEVCIAYDGDGPGQKAIMRGLDILEAENIPVKVLVFPDKLDPDEFIRQRGVEAFRQLVPLKPVEYRLQRAKEGLDLGADDGREEYAKACGKILKAVKEPVELDGHIRRLSLETGFSTEVLYRQVGSTPAPEPRKVTRQPSLSRQVKAMAEIDWNARTLIAILACGKLPLDIVSADEFEDSNLRALCEALQSGKNVPEILESQPDEQSRTFVSEVLNIDTDMDDDCLMRTAQDCLRKLRISRLEKELDAVQKLLPTLPPQQQEAESLHASAILKQLLELK